MRTVSEHFAVVSALFPEPETIDLPLSQALGRVLARDVVADISLPPFNNSAMDGYAVRRADLGALADPRAGSSMTSPSPISLPVAADIPAGTANVAPLAPGTAARIMTGAPVPEGADQVVPVELTDGGTGRVTISEQVGERTHIRPLGDDIQAGTTILTAGTPLTPAAIGAAAAVGQATATVFRPLTVLVLSTGSELAEPGQPLRPGQIYESNGHMLAAAVKEAGAVAKTAHFVPDNVDEFREAIRGARDGVDVLLTSGGVSAGAYEVVKDAFTGAGVEFAKVAMQPGMPQGAGRFEGLPVITLPGNPVSSFISFEVFVRPALRAAMGLADPHRPAVRLTLTEALTSPEDKTQFRRGTFDAVAGTVTPIGGPGSHLLGALAAADCLIVIPAGTATLDAGSDVEVWLLAS